MRITNSKKFIRMVILIVGIIVTISFYFCNISFSKGEIKTKTIYVSNGDTLWSIAQNEQKNNEYYINKDVRDIVYEIRKLNNIQNNSNLIVGQKLVVNNL